ncbi:MAG: DUF7706 family protein [Enterobacteriaceae bacterium]
MNCCPCQETPSLTERKQEYQRKSCGEYEFAGSLQACALAQFVKRVGWDEIRINARNETECYLMRDAINQLQKALAEQGYAPR